MPDITILPEHFNRILKVTGFPIITDTDLEYTVEDIKSLFIWPAMEEFFIWFPIKEAISYSVGTSFSHDFPNEFVYDIVDARINTSGFKGVGKTDSPFQNALLFNHPSEGRYNTPYDYGFDIARLDSLLENQAYINLTGTKKFTIDMANRKVSGYSNIGGELIITWAAYSTDFAAIPFKRIKDVIKLAQANLLEALGILRGQANTNTNVEFDYQLFLDKAEEYREEVIENWENFTKVVIARG